MLVFLLFAAELFGPVMLNIGMFPTPSTHQFSLSPSKASPDGESPNPAKRLDFSPGSNGTLSPSPAGDSVNRSDEYHAYLFRKEPEVLSLVPVVGDADTKTKAQELTTALEESRKETFSPCNENIGDEFWIVGVQKAVGRWNGVFQISKQDASKRYVVIIQNAISAAIRNSFIKTLLEAYENRKTYFPQAYEVKSPQEGSEIVGQGSEEGVEVDPTKVDVDKPKILGHEGVPGEPKVVRQGSEEGVEVDPTKADGDEPKTPGHEVVVSGEPEVVGQGREEGLGDRADPIKADGDEPKIPGHEVVVPREPEVVGQGREKGLGDRADPIKADGDEPKIPGHEVVVPGEPEVVGQGRGEEGLGDKADPIKVDGVALPPPDPKVGVSRPEQQVTNSVIVKFWACCTWVCELKNRPTIMMDLLVKYGCLFKEILNRFIPWLDRRPPCFLATRVAADIDSAHYPAQA